MQDPESRTPHAPPPFPATQPPAAPSTPPAFQAPASVLLLIAVLLLVHLLRLHVLSPGQDLVLLATLAVFPELYAVWWQGVALSRLPVEGIGLLLSPFGHFFLHASWPHVIMNALWLLVFATPVARRLGGLRMLLLALLSAAGGALLFVLLHWGEEALLVGASGGVSGLMGASVRLIYAHGLPLLAGLRQDVRHVQPLSLRQALLLPRPRLFILVWIGINIVITFTGMGVGSGMGRIAGEAHIGGFFTGMALFGLLDRRR